MRRNIRDPDSVAGRIASSASSASLVFSASYPASPAPPAASPAAFPAASRASLAASRASLAASRASRATRRPIPLLKASRPPFHGVCLGSWNDSERVLVITAVHKWGSAVFEEGSLKSQQEALSAESYTKTKGGIVTKLVLAVFLLTLGTFMFWGSYSH